MAIDSSEQKARKISNIFGHHPALRVCVCVQEVINIIHNNLSRFLQEAG